MNGMRRSFLWIRSLTFYSGLFMLGLLTACAFPPSRSDVSPARFQFHLEASDLTSTNRQFTAVLPVSGSSIRVDRLPVFDSGDVVSVDLAEVALGACLRFRMNSAGARALYQLTAEKRGLRLVLLVEGNPVGVRVIDDVLADGMLFTFVEVPDADLPALVLRLQSAIR